MRKLSSHLNLLACTGASIIMLTAANPAVATQMDTHAKSTITSQLPETRPVDPVLMLVSLQKQQIKVLVGDRLVARSKVSTGKKGHRTPTGIFSVLQKKRRHHSNIYSRAPMPYMQRLTWSGIALHESKSVPARPASHGCVRLPNAFAKQLYGFTDRGAHVIITDEELNFAPLWHGNLLYPDRKPVQKPLQSVSDEGSLQSYRQNNNSMSPVLLAQNGSPADLNGPDANALASDGFVLRASLKADAPTERVIDRFELPDSDSPVRILITRRTGRELVRDIQTMLTELGYDTGDADGWMGPDTGNAIIRFQNDNGRKPTGSLSMSLARALHEASGKGPFPAAHIYARQDFKPVFDAPVVMENPQLPLGTHFITGLKSHTDRHTLRWLSATLANTPQPSALSDIGLSSRPGAPLSNSVSDALDRLTIPAYIKERLLAMLVPGSSIIISDDGISDESHLGTDFIVLTKSHSKH